MGGARMAQGGMVGGREVGGASEEDEEEEEGAGTWSVYLLLSADGKKTYVGVTMDAERRRGPSLILPCPFFPSPLPLFRHTTTERCWKKPTHLRSACTQLFSPLFPPLSPFPYSPPFPTLPLSLLSPFPYSPPFPLSSPPSRLKQHNGEVVGGAKSTRAGRPWALVSVVSGFRTRSEAFQFEWRWKNPRKLRGDGTAYDRIAYDRTGVSSASAAATASAFDPSSSPSAHAAAAGLAAAEQGQSEPHFFLMSNVWRCTIGIASRLGDATPRAQLFDRAALFNSVATAVRGAACFAAASATIFPPSFGRVVSHSHGSAATHSPDITYRSSSEAPQKSLGSVSHGSAATLDSPGVTYQWYWVKLRPTKHKGKVIGDRGAFGTLFWKIMKFSRTAYYISLYWEYRKLSSGAIPVLHSGTSCTAAGTIWDQNPQVSYINMTTPPKKGRKPRYAFYKWYHYTPGHLQKSLDIMKTGGSGAAIFHMLHTWTSSVAHSFHVCPPAYYERGDPSLFAKMRVKMLHAVVTTGFATPANIHPRIALRQLPHFTRPLSSATPAALETAHAQAPRAPSATSEHNDGQPHAARSADSRASYGGGGGGGGRGGGGGGGGGRGDGGKQNWNRARGGGGGSPPSDLFGHQIGREGRRFGQPIVERKGRTIDERKGGNTPAPPPPFPRRKGPGGKGPADGAGRGRKEAESFRQGRLGGRGISDGSDSGEENDDDVYDDMDDVADMEADLLPGIPRNPLPRSAREGGFGSSAGAGAAAGAGIGGTLGVAEAEVAAEGEPGAGMSWIMNDVDMDDLSMFAPVSLKSAVLDPVLNLSPAGFEPSSPMSSSGVGDKWKLQQGGQSQQGAGMLKKKEGVGNEGEGGEEEGEEEGERLVPEQWRWVQEEPKWVSLHTMAATGQTPFVSHLLASGAAVDALDAHGATMLHHAVRTGNVEMARLLLQKGADVNAADQWGWTPMHVAAQSGRIEMVRALLVLGGKTRVQAQDGRTPLDIAQAYGPAHGLYSVVEMLRRPPKCG
ncbi:unnamed protein product [Closterium sp. Yama58-4]|nr:unnamed protein product [Closterium sp. Yama58-4]